jgi:cyanophycin synthetase
MEFRKVLALRGPNIWADYPVLEAWLDLGALKDSPSDELPGFNDRLMRWLPGMIEHRCSVGTRGGFFERLRRGTYQAHILEHVALELQTLAGTEVGYGRTRESSEDGVYKVAIEYEEEELGRAALEVARVLCLAAVHDLPFDVEAEVAKLRELGQRVRLSVGTAAIIKAARKRKIPVRRLGDAGLLQLGYGARQRRLRDSQTDRTGALAETIAADPELARTLLRAVGIPVPEGPLGVSAEEAWAAGQARGVPVWRLLVVGDRVAAAARRDSASCPGDNGNRGTTGSAIDATDRVHPDVAARAVEAAQVIGLDVAGIDIVAADIGRPLEEQKGFVAAVLARPGLDVHLRPAAGTPQPVAEAVVGRLFPDDATGRIPIVAVTGVNGKTTTSRLVAHIVGRHLRPVGMTCTEGIYIDSRRIEAGDCSGPKSAAAVLQNPRVEAAVLETARGGILREGLGFDRCDVAVVTNIGEGDHLGVCDIETLEQLARVKRTVVEAVGPGGTAVLNATEPLVAGMASHCRGSVVFFALDGNHTVIVRHRGAKGRTVFTRDNHIILAEGEQEIRLVSLDRVPLTHGGRIRFQVQNALAAAAAAWSLGVPCELIRVGLESFSPNLGKSPARFNLLEIQGATVILDYGHNPSALAALIAEFEQFPHSRRLAVYSTAGDRRDRDLIRQGELLGHAFDHVILYEDHYTRGRQPGEIISLFRRGLVKGSRVEEIHEVQGAVKAMEAGLATARPGDLVLVQADEIDESVEFMRRLLASGVPGREVNLSEVLAVVSHQTLSVTCSVNSEGDLPDSLVDEGVLAS